MSSDRSTSTARIPTGIDAETKLVGSYTLSDLAVGCTPAVVVALLIQVVIPADLVIAGVRVQSLFLPAVVIGGAVGFSIVALTPAYTSSLTWLESVWSFLIGQTRYNAGEAGGVSQVARVWEEYDAIERQDGSLIGMVQVDPASMDLATQADWDRRAAQFASFLNGTVTFPIQIYATPRDFPVEEHLAPYRQRADDEDIQANPALANVLAGYIDWYQQDCDRRTMALRDYYLVVVAEPREVASKEGEIFDRLLSLPLIGAVTSVWLDSPAAERRAQLAELLQDRLRAVERGIRGIEDCSGRVLTGIEAATVIGDYWSNSAADEPVEAVPRTPVRRAGA